MKVVVVKFPTFWQEVLSRSLHLSTTISCS